MVFPEPGEPTTQLWLGPSEIESTGSASSVFFGTLTIYLAGVTISCRNLVAGGINMDVRIGITQSPRDLTFESAQSAAELSSEIQKAIESGAPLLSLKDEKGKTLLIPTASISFVEIGAEKARPVGFVA